jgi:hypothetical protein
VAQATRLPDRKKVPINNRATIYGSQGGFRASHLHFLPAPFKLMNELPDGNYEYLTNFRGDARSFQPKIRYHRNQSSGRLPGRATNH